MMFFQLWLKFKTTRSIKKRSLKIFSTIKTMLSNLAKFLINFPAKPKDPLQKIFNEISMDQILLDFIVEKDLLSVILNRACVTEHFVIIKQIKDLTALFPVGFPMKYYRMNDVEYPNGINDLTQKIKNLFFVNHNISALIYQINKFSYINKPRQKISLCVIEDPFWTEDENYRELDAALAVYEDYYKSPVVALKKILRLCHARVEKTFIEHIIKQLEKPEQNLLKEYILNIIPEMLPDHIKHDPLFETRLAFLVLALGKKEHQDYLDDSLNAHLNDYLYKDKE